MDVNQTIVTGSLNPDANNKNPNHKSKSRQNQSSKKSQTDPWRELEAFEFDGPFLKGLPTEVQNTIDSLVNRIEFLRQQLEQSKGREEHYRKLSEFDQSLDIPCRAFFLQKLKK